MNRYVCEHPSLSASAFAVDVLVFFLVEETSSATVVPLKVTHLTIASGGRIDRPVQDRVVEGHVAVCVRFGSIARCTPGPASMLYDSTFLV